jgi:hypothetical protein
METYILLPEREYKKCEREMKPNYNVDVSDVLAKNIKGAEEKAQAIQNSLATYLNQNKLDAKGNQIKVIPNEDKPLLEKPAAAVVVMPPVVQMPVPVLEPAKKTPKLVKSPTAKILTPSKQKHQPDPEPEKERPKRKGAIKDYKGMGKMQIGTGKFRIW